jgi:hypothetical protein
MKNIAKISSILLLSLLMLTSSMGISINKMICLSSGKVKVALWELKDCCPEEEEENSNLPGFQARCCDFFSEYVQVDFLSMENNFQLKLIKSFFTPILSLFCQYFSLFTANSSEFYGDIPPPVHGISLLKLISVFRI